MLPFTHHRLYCMMTMIVFDTMPSRECGGVRMVCGWCAFINAGLTTLHTSTPTQQHLAALLGCLYTAHAAAHTTCVRTHNRVH